MLVLRYPGWKIGNSQNFLFKFVICTFRSFAKQLSTKSQQFMFFTLTLTFWISSSKTTFSHYNLKILRPKVTKYLTNLPKKFCEFRPKNFLKRETFFCWPGVDFTNVLCAAFTLVDPESKIMIDNFTVFFTLLGYTLIKALS